MNIYYSHPKQMYSENIEKTHIKIIKNQFTTCNVINPKNYKSGDMDFYLKKVEQSDILIYVKLKNQITAGVGKEVNRALECKITVYEIKHNKLHLRKNKVKHLTPSESYSLTK